MTERRNDIDSLVTGYLFDDLTQEEEARLRTLVERGEVDDHELDELRQTLSIVSLHEPAEPPYGFWDNFTDNVLRQAERSKTSAITRHWNEWISRWRGALLPQVRFPLQAAFVVALVLVGIVLGRTVFSPDVDLRDSLVQTGDATDEAMLAFATEEYLGRSKTLLLGIVHADNGEASELNLPRRREMARELMRTAADIKPSLDNPNRRRLHELVSEIELILIQIANLEMEHDLPAIEMVRHGVERKGLLFKINVEEMRRIENSGPPRGTANTKTRQS